MHCWLRTKFGGPIETNNKPMPLFYCHGIRDDGQMFQSHIFTDGTNTAAIFRELRAKLDTMIEDAAMPPTTDDDGVIWSNKVPLDAYKGHPGWVEENNGMLATSSEGDHRTSERTARNRA